MGKRKKSPHSFGIRTQWINMGWENMVFARHERSAPIRQRANVSCMSDPWVVIRPDQDPGRDRGDDSDFFFRDILWQSESLGHFRKLSMSSENDRTFPTISTREEGVIWCVCIMIIELSPLTYFNLNLFHSILSSHWIIMGKLAKRISINPLKFVDDSKFVFLREVSRFRKGEITPILWLNLSIL